MTNPKRSFFSMLGPPASGKGTQGRQLAEYLKVPYCSSGARLRQEIASGSELGKRAEVFLSRNEYVPDELALELVGSWLNENRQGWVLDGFPRSLPQAEFLLDELQFPLMGIHLEVPFEVLYSRIEGRRECLPCGLTLNSSQDICSKCGLKTTVRKDDTSAGFQSRFEEYQTNTLPVLDFLRSRDQLLEVDGTGAVEEIWGRIENLVG